MAICKWCQNDMSDDDVTTCTSNLAVDYPDDVSLSPIPFVPQPRMSPEAWMAMWRKSNEDFILAFPESASTDSEDQARVRCENYQARWDRCHDCGVRAGGIHHPGCDDERCPRCAGQLIGCGCLGGKS